MRKRRTSSNEIRRAGAPLDAIDLLDPERMATKKRVVAHIALYKSNLVPAAIDDVSRLK